MKNRMMKRVLFVAALSVSITACSVQENIENETFTPETIDELTANRSFDWSTAKDYTINYQGVAVGNAVKRPLVIKNQSNEIIRKVNMALSDNITVSIVIPANDERIIISWGSHERIVNLGEHKTIDFTFVEPEAEEEE